MSNIWKLSLLLPTLLVSACGDKDDEKTTVPGPMGQIELAMTNNSSSLNLIDEDQVTVEPTVYDLKIIAINLIGTNPFDTSKTIEVSIWANPKCTLTEQTITQAGEEEDEILEFTWKDPFSCKLEDMEYVPLQVSTDELNAYLDATGYPVPATTYTGVNLMLSDGKDKVETIKVIRFQAPGMDDSHEIVGFDGGLSANFSEVLEVTEDTDTTVTLEYDLSGALKKSVGDSADNLPIETDNCYQDADILTTWCTALGAGAIVPSVE